MTKRLHKPAAKSLKSWRFRRFPSLRRSRAARRCSWPRPASARQTLRAAAPDPQFLAGVLDSSCATTRLCWPSPASRSCTPTRPSPTRARRSTTALGARRAVSGPRHASRRLLPRLPGRRRRQGHALPGLRLAAPAPPPRARRADHRPCRLRRVLRHDREARRSRPRRQAADHRRRQARRRLDRLLHRAHLRRALGDADVQGAAALPARRRRPARHGEIRPRRPRRCAARCSS